jgi:hypothetical protein
VNSALATHGLNFPAPLGAVPGAAVAATFGVFEPDLIDGLWREGRAGPPRRACVRCSPRSPRRPR